MAGQRELSYDVSVIKPKLLLSCFAFLSLAAVGQAAPIFFFANLDGPSEFPPVPSPGFGTAYVTIDPIAHMMRVQVDFANLLGTVTVSHIHVINGPNDANFFDTIGPVATTVPTFTGFPSGVTSGSYDQTFDMTLASSYNPAWITGSGGTVAAAEAQLFSGILDGRAYLNIHTQLFPAGEIRGFLQPVPEPGMMALLGLSAAGLAWRRRLKAKK